ncbi:MAG: hypothetical protein K6F23_08505 [Solobacterium sp.]|nr:hypothetical protein [Solobacterium sp.]
MTHNESISSIELKMGQHEKYAYFIGRKYREARKILAEIRNPDEMNKYDIRRAYGALLITAVEQSLPMCSETTQQIIRKGFLEEHPANWYEAYYSRFKYWYLKNKAVRQFAHTMEKLEKNI